jgi:hypothetical protein
MPFSRLEHSKAGKGHACPGRRHPQRKGEKEREEKQRSAFGPTLETVPPVVHEVRLSAVLSPNPSARASTRPRFAYDFSRIPVPSRYLSYEYW